MSRRRRVLWSLPWVIAPACLAVPLVGGGFAGWPFVIGWLVLLVMIWWVRPLGGADRTARLGVGVFVIAILALFSTFGGLFLIPAVLVSMALVATEPPLATPDGQQVREQSPHS
jgi:hypothetical protein